jgi:hypothetical protein
MVDGYDCRKTKIFSHRAHRVSQSESHRGSVILLCEGAGFERSRSMLLLLCVPLWFKLSAYLRYKIFQNSSCISGKFPYSKNAN